MITAYRTIEVSVKLADIKNYWVTSNVSETARQYGISRDALYRWSKLAEATIIEPLQKATSGRRSVSLKEQNEILREQIEKLFDVCHKLSPEREVAPLVERGSVCCPDRGSMNLPKNGKVLTKRHGFRQRFICRHCSVSIYVELKKLCKYPCPYSGCSPLYFCITP